MRIMTPAELDDAWHGLQFDVRRSVRYHRRRQSFFERLDLAADVLLVLLGAILIYGIFAPRPDGLALAAAATFTAMMIIPLASAPRQARLHAGLARRFIELECQLLADPAHDLLQQISAARLTIEMGEPPVLRVLDALCHNEQLRAQGQLEYRVGPITQLQRMFAQWLDIHPERIMPSARHDAPL